jgi:hypothetical protein
MKRSLTDTRVFGFCDSASRYFALDPSDFDYFQACDDSVLLCNDEDHDLTSLGVLHQSLPSRFQNVDLYSFAKFVNKQTLKPNTCFDFSDWSELLAFLGAKPKFNEKLKSLVSVSNCRHAILSAFRTANILANAGQQAKIPISDDNADFFVAHNMEVLFSEERDPSVKLYIPDEIVQMLDPKVMILASYKVVAKTRCKANWNVLDFVTGTNNTDTLLQVCAILISHNYIITRENHALTKLCAIAPADSPDFDNVYMETVRNLKYEFAFYIPCHQVCLVSPTKLMLSAQAKYQWTHGIQFQKDMKLMLGFIVDGLMIDYKEVWNASEIEEAKYFYPMQHAGLSRVANVAQLKLQGYAETDVFAVQKSDNDASDSSDSD